MNDQYLSRAEIADRLGVLPHAIYTWERQGLFPKAIKLSRRAVRYSLADVETWLEARKAQAAVAVEAEVA